MDFLERLFSTSFGSPNVALATTCSYSHAPILSTNPPGYSDVSAILLNDHLAVIPGEWKSGDLTSPFYDIKPTDPCIADAFAHTRAVDFVAWQESFFPFIGKSAKVETIQTFSPDAYRVHEAPVYIPETNELLYSDTSLIGQLWAINIDTHVLRKILLSSPLANINGATSHEGTVYVATNGGPVRGIYTLNHTTGAVTSTITNHFRGRHLNSPNDLILDSRGNLYFTDPTYGWEHRWPGVGAPELPPSVYRLDARTRALTVVATGLLAKPNGLALASDERTLYVADSASTAGGIAAQRGVWAFPVEGHALGAPRLVHVVEGGWPDGVRVTARGWLMVAVAGGVDVVDPETGALLGKINTADDVIYNLEPARDRGVWLLTGRKRIYKVTIQEGPVETSWSARAMRDLHRLSTSLWNYV